MNQRKTNNTLWYSLGLAVLLCIAFLVSTTGTALARYRSEQKVPLTFQVRVPARICLGTMETRVVAEETEETEAMTEEIFVPNVKPEWLEVEEDMHQLRLVVANGTSDADFSEKGQRVRLRLFGSLGVWSGSETAKITVRTGTEPEILELEGTVTYIDEQSPLYATYGYGWVYTFQIPETEEEYVWILPGGSFRYVDLTVVMDGNAVSDSALLQPQIISELITE